MGPYYLTCLINLLGPIYAVSGMQSMPREVRTIGSGPRMGQSFDVAVPTHISALLQFEKGARITLTTSFDVWTRGHNHIELYGSLGSMIVSDPNQFQLKKTVTGRPCHRCIPMATGTIVSWAWPIWRMK